MKRRIWLITMMLAAGTLAGCGRTEEPKAAEQTEEAEQSGSEGASSGEAQSGSESASSGEAQPGETEQDPEAAASRDFSFADVADREFYFSSGAGGWYTVLYIHEDGTFDGHYQDSDMGVSAPEYPNGTLYYSDFTGKFTEPEKVDDITWAFQIETIEYPLGFGTEIKDGYYYNYETAYGLDGAEELYMYLPGAVIADLPEAYRSWVGYYNLDLVTETELPFYGLYNVTQEEGFSSYSYEKSEAAARVEAEIADAEAKAADLEADLQNAQSQADLNVISGEIYTVWDNALNTVWGILKEELKEEYMKQLTEEERAWIAEKEAAVKEAGAEVEGGSMYAMVINGKAAELTKARVYELAEYLK